MENDCLLTRRDLVCRGGAAITLATAASSIGPALALDGERSLASGVVFEDRSGTAVRQRNDPGIPGVLVSNGRDVARTDRDGRYTLPVEDAESSSW